MADEKRRTILCVDDEEDITNTLKDTFMDLYDVKTAKDGKEGLEVFNASEIDLVISDQRMPEMTGSELLKAVNERKPICKKILLTGYADIDAAIDAINKGSVDKYFNKPWDEDELLASVADLLEELKTDEFFETALDETKQFKDNADSAQKDASLFGKFLDNCFGGVCLVGENETIEYVNKHGLDLLKYDGIDDIKGKSYTDVFMMDDKERMALKVKYKESSTFPSTVKVECNDGKKKSIQGWVSFAQNNGDLELLGITFF
ncbi:MAG: response regulator [Candidatus Anammoxibacter sp.]